MLQVRRQSTEKPICRILCVLTNPRERSKTPVSRSSLSTLPRPTPPAWIGWLGTLRGRGAVGALPLAHASGLFTFLARGHYTGTPPIADADLNTLGRYL